VSGVSFASGDLDRLRAATRPTLLVGAGQTEQARRVALLSGSFDPVTVGHDALAAAAAGSVDMVLLVYSVRTLPKEAGATAPLLSEDERLRVLEAFCRVRPGLAPALCSHGLVAEQVAAAADRFPRAHVAVVAGSDKVLQLLDPWWYRDRDAELGPMFERAEVWYAVREGDREVVEHVLAAPENAAWAGRFRPLDVDVAVAAVSSRWARELARGGQDISGLVPPQAMDAIRRAVASEHGL
jgi:nicotinic acid mononucleotide adenylyltransferase